MNSDYMNSTMQTILEDLANPWAKITFTPLEYKILGTIFMILIITFIIPYMIVLYIFITSSKFKKHYSYHIMFHLGIMDILQLITYFGSLAIMMLSNQSFPFLLNKIISSLGIATWLGMGIMTLILAINRFIKLLDIQYFTSISAITFYKVLLIFGYVLTSGFVILMLLPDMGLTIDILWFVYEANFEYYNLMGVFTYIDIFMLTMALILYLIAVGYLILHRHFRTSTTKLIKHHELRLFFQTMFICVYKSIVGTMISFWVPPDTLSCAIFYCFALIESGYNPYMYLLLNRYGNNDEE